MTVDWCDNAIISCITLALFMGGAKDVHQTDYKILHILTFYSARSWKKSFFFHFSSFHITQIKLPDYKITIYAQNKAYISRKYVHMPKIKTTCIWFITVNASWPDEKLFFIHLDLKCITMEWERYAYERALFRNYQLCVWLCVAQFSACVRSSQIHFG